MGSLIPRGRRVVAWAAIVGILLATSCGERGTPAGDGAAGSIPAAGDSRSSGAPAPPVRSEPKATAATGPSSAPPLLPARDPSASPTTTTTSAGPVVRSGANVDDDADAGLPLTIAIADLDVAGDIVPVGLLADGTLDVPVDPGVVGWLSSGPRPGDRGPAVIAGHVDSRQLGPGLFWHLADLDVGAEVTITTDTSTLTFVVDSVEQYPKDEFPTDAVYGPVPTPALRLITCGGSFDSTTRHYRDNIVVSLTLR